MSTMSDKDVITWARTSAFQCDIGANSEMAAKLRRRLADLAEKGAKRENVCVIGGEECPRHNYAHGREAEELRAGVERLMARSDHKKVSSADLQKLLDRVDARDSLAYLENGGRPLPAPPGGER